MVLVPLSRQCVILSECIWMAGKDYGYLIAIIIVFYDLMVFSIKLMGLMLMEYWGR